VNGKNKIYKHKINSMNTKELKPFDLEKAKNGHPVVYLTRSEERYPAKLIYSEFENGDLVFVVKFYEGAESVLISDTSGYIKSAYGKLMMVSVKKKMWVNIYKDAEGSYYVDGLTFDSEDKGIEMGSAVYAGGYTYIQTIPIEIEEKY
jgi:hypothetical protein